jgi:hypothetical protein
MIGPERGQVVAVERLLAVCAKDALDGFMRRNIPAGEAGILPGFPRVATSAVDLFQ